MITHVYLNYYKNIFYFFSSLSIRMSGNSIKFDDKKKIKKATSTKKKYLV